MVFLNLYFLKMVILSEAFLFLLATVAITAVNVISGLRRKKYIVFLWYDKYTKKSPPVRVVLPGPVAQSVARLIADPGVVSVNHRPFP